MGALVSGYWPGITDEQRDSLTCFDNDCKACGDRMAERYNHNATTSRIQENSGECRFATFDTLRAELQKLLGKEQPAVVIIEACLLAGWVHDLCGELQMRCLLRTGQRNLFRLSPSPHNSPAK